MSENDMTTTLRAIRASKRRNLHMKRQNRNFADHWEIGKIYLIRTVTHIQTGRLVAVTPKEFVLEDAAWIADTGRFSGALASAVFTEVEPFPKGRRVIVGRGSLIDAVKIDKAPMVQK